MQPELDQPAVTTRRNVLRTGAVLTAAAVGGAAATGGAAAEKPDFSARIWGEGQRWGTKVTGVITHPNERSLDKFFVITNPVDGQLDGDTLPVAEAAPGNPDYNGGRWWTHVAAWTEAGISAHGSPPPLLTRYGPASDPESIAFHEALGHIEITEGSPGGAGAPPDYFRCPMLPLKE